MPTKAAQPCQTPGCAEYRPCPTHRATDHRPHAHARGYGRRWQALRTLILHRDPICQSCHAAPSTDVDHITPKRDGGRDIGWNLQGLCHSCHSTKTGKGR